MRKLEAVVRFIAEAQNFLPEYRRVLERITMRMNHLREQHGLATKPQFSWGGTPEGEVDFDWRIYDFERSQGMLDVVTTSWSSTPPGIGRIHLKIKKTGYVTIQGHISDFGLSWDQATASPSKIDHKDPNFKMTPEQLFNALNFFYQKWHEVLGVPKEEAS